MTRAVKIIVVGAGPAGLSAALCAAQAGAQVTLLDGYARPGGQYYIQPPGLPGIRPTRRQHEGLHLWQQVQAAGVEILSGTQVWSLSPDRSLAAAGPQGSVLYQGEAVILAAGAYERVPAFPGWTLPGVITSGAAQAMLSQAVRPGKRALVCGSGPLQLTTAAKLLQAGVEVCALLEGGRILPCGLRHLPALWGQWERAREGLESLLILARHGVPSLTGWGLLSVHGQNAVEGARIARLDADWRPIPGSEQTLACDTVCVGWGLIPFNALSRMAGARQEWRPELGGEVPMRDAQMQTSLDGIYAAGDGAGIGGYRMALLEGSLAGLAAAARLGYARPDLPAQQASLRARLEREAGFQRLYSELFTPGPGIYELADESTLVCRCEGVTLRALRQAVQNGSVRSINEAKNLTRAGMGECQGRVCGQQVAHLLAGLSGFSLAEVGLPNPRPPLLPLPIERLILKE